MANRKAVKYARVLRVFIAKSTESRGKGKLEMSVFLLRDGLSAVLGVYDQVFVYFIHSAAIDTHLHLETSNRKHTCTIYSRWLY